MSGFAELSSAAHSARMQRPTVPLALATLVGVEGSSYRQPGARLLVDAEGRVLAGAISGGCLEGDVAARADAVCRAGTATVLTYDLRTDLETIWGFGSACDGIATVLLEPLPDAGWLADADTMRRSRCGGVVITHVGSAVIPPRGTMALSNAASGAAAEGSTPDLAHGIAIAQRTARAHVVHSSDGAFFIEPLIAPIALHVIGAGRGAEAFARIATTLGWDVTVIDHRPALLDALSLSEGVRALALRADDDDRALVSDTRTAVALLTHIFDTDLAWLARLLPSAVGYIGVLGSRQRAAKLMERLREDGLECTAAMLQRVHAPIGLDLGGESPESIALAAIAEIEARMHARPGGALRERQSPIHERTPVPVPVTNTTATIVDATCQLPRP